MRVMRVLTRPNLGGPTRQAVALWHAHRAMGVETLLVTGRVHAGESTLDPEGCGVPRLVPEAVRAGSVRGGGWVVVEDMGRGIHPLRDLRARRQLQALAAAWQPDVVHSHTSKAGALVRTALRSAPVLAHTYHGHVLADYFHPVVAAGFRWLERRWAQRTDLLVAVSPSCADELAALGIAPRERFEVARPAVPLAPVVSRADARLALGIGSSEFRVAAVGRLVPVKRMEWFVAALQGLEGVHGDVWGSGPEEARLRSTAGDNVSFRGTRPDLQPLLSAYDAVVLPSVREGCPLVAVEAFAAGVPVVGCDVPGVRDVLTSWGVGVLVPEAEGPRGLRAALDRLRRDPAGASALGAKGIACAAEFAPGRLAQRLVESYASLLP